MLHTPLDEPNPLAPTVDHTTSFHFLAIGVFLYLILINLVYPFESLVERLLIITGWVDAIAILIISESSKLALYTLMALWFLRIIKRALKKRTPRKIAPYLIIGFLLAYAFSFLYGSFAPEWLYNFDQDAHSEYLDDLSLYPNIAYIYPIFSLSKTLIFGFILLRK